MFQFSIENLMKVVVELNFEGYLECVEGQMLCYVVKLYRDMYMNNDNEFI